MKTGLFVTFEGPDGSGKTTVSTAVTKMLEADGYQVRYTREPGGSNIAEQIRQVILDPKNTEMDARTEALLYAASRRQHLVDKVLPVLAQGVHVISDRFVDSSLAYQGCGREIGMDEVYEINQFAIENHMPDKTIFLQIDAETGLKRIRQESVEFHERVHEGYQKVIEKYADRMIIVDATADVDTVIQKSYEIVKGLLDAQG